MRNNPDEVFTASFRSKCSTRKGFKWIYVPHTIQMTDNKHTARRLIETLIFHTILRPTFCCLFRDCVFNQCEEETFLMNMSYRLISLCII